ncbi:hypothetical protein [Mycolicibacterium tusciae]|uniref:hypothetical protein n=1 Tax=Mycolicibacterium tusciae TaxID=75922 RepID=UPI001F225F44|nr:hypothetical protein [Mycolicibacterium tusciae]
MGDIVRYNEAPTKWRLRSVIALTVAFWALLIGGAPASPWTETSDNHAAHVLTATTADQLAVVSDHSHLGRDVAAKFPDTFATAVLPRATSVLVALGLALAVVAAWLYGGQGILGTVRGPPDGPKTVTSGRQLLACFCISRR